MNVRLPTIDGIIADLVSLGLPAEAVRIIRQIIHANAPARKPLARTPAALSSIADTFRQRSIERKEILGGLLNDAAWNMLLALFTAAEKGESLNVTNVCYASGSPYTTALRHLDALEQMGLIDRTDDPTDRRRSIVVPRLATMDRMRRAILGFCIAPPAL